MALRRSAPVGRGVGERYEQVIETSGRELSTDFEVVEYDPNRHIAFRGTSGDVQARGSYDFAAEGGATRVDVRAEIQVSGALAGTEPYIRKVVQHVGDDDLRRLRRLLEANPRGGA